MELKINFTPALSAGTSVVVALGVFDGVHRGHQAILSQTVTLARELNALPVAVTFSPHPRQVFHLALDLLQSVDDRLLKLREFGMRSVGIFEFNQVAAALPPEEFFRQFTEELNLNIVGIVVGSDWRFGAKSVGDTNLLKKLAFQRGISAIAVPTLTRDGKKISSTAIRSALLAGEVELVNELAGYPFEFAGEVVAGHHYASEILKTPTANLSTPILPLLKPGVYAAKVKLENYEYIAIANCGVSPTFDYETPEKRLELHLLDFSGEIYGKTLRVHLAKHLRDESKFATADELKAQINLDIATVYKVFEANKA